MTGVLEGIRVIDFGQFIAGPLAPFWKISVVAIPGISLIAAGLRLILNLQLGLSTSTDYRGYQGQPTTTKAGQSPSPGEGRNVYDRAEERRLGVWPNSGKGGHDWR